MKYKAHFEYSMMVKKILLAVAMNFILFNAFSQGIPICPSINAGADVTICTGQCTKLLAAVNTNYITTTYSVNQIAYTPYSFTGAPILVNTDDGWSPAINLGFNFCYFGNTYNKAVIGANGQISFDITKASGFESWMISKPIPDTSNGKNTISVNYKDIDPALGGNVYYQTVGSAPCRALIISWVNIPLFSCSTSLTTFQAVFYETTNVIDIYLQNSPVCALWNGGYGIIGLQNASGTGGISPNGRNYPAAWSAANEAWRFSPTGAPSYNVTWSNSGGIISTGLGVTVCPTTNTTYTSKMVITNCDGSILNYTDSLIVKINTTTTSTAVITANSATVCLGSSATLIATGGSVYSWSPIVGLNHDTGSVVTATPSVTTTYTLTGSNGSCADTSLSTVTVSVPPIISVSIANDSICKGSSTVLNASGASTYTWSPAISLSGSTGASVTATPTLSTTYTISAHSNGCTNTAITTALVTVVTPITAATITTTSICPGSCNGTAFVTVTGGLANHYLWNTGSANSSISSLCAGSYSVQITNIYCSSTFTRSATIVAPPNLNLTPTVVGSTCLYGGNGSISVVASGGNGAPYTFSFNTGLFSTTSVFANLTAGTYTITVKDINGCLKSIFVPVPQSANNVPPLLVNSDTICLNSSTVLKASGAATYTWVPATFLNTSIGAIVTATPSVSINYTVAATDNNGCKNAAVATVMVVNSYTVFSNGVSVCPKPITDVTVYNSFSPNGDGLNDVFEIDNIDKFIPNHVYIYNRWGQLLWDKQDYNNTSVVWDGKDNKGNIMAPGTYYFIIEVEGKTGIKHWVELTK